MASFLVQFRGQVILVFHAVTVAISLVAAFLLRFDFSIPDEVHALVLQTVCIAWLLKLPVFFKARLHTGSWRFAGIPELRRILVANAIASAAFTLVALFWHHWSGFPRSVCVIDFLVCFLLAGGAQFTVRAYSEARSAAVARRDAKGILIYGAGAAGRMLLREIQANPSLGYDVVGFVDDDRRLRGSTVMNVPIIGRGREIAAIVDRYDMRSARIEEIVVAMPSATARQRQEAIANCRSAGVPCKTIPRFGELLAGKVLSSQIRNISLLDLLGREQVRLEENRIHESIAGRSILVTGAAGSIGSELCRQTARFQPARLVLFDQAESPLYNIDLELRAQFPSLDIVAELGDVRDARVVEDIVRRHHANSIFHAAAYKHVPLMEAHILEAVKTNVLGTWNLVRTAYRNHVSNFLMISTDKAVNPSSVMGVTKRVAELIVYAQGSNGNTSSTRFASVRFGNVLGSNGSVVPLFQSQIASGGPVTVTHPDMRRYFMSVPEAVELVLQASTMCKDSEIFVLDMGEPVRIMDLATNMIGLAGLVPNQDIEIRITGLRPGEKLFEELRIEGEDISPTYHDKIKIFTGTRLTRSQLEAWLSPLMTLVEARDAEAVLSHLRTLVPEYQPQPPFRGCAEQPQTLTASYQRRDARSVAKVTDRWHPSPTRHTPIVQPSST
jgi:FlaA1/EpsC-like NDP-sugar epimerase